MRSDPVAAGSVLGPAAPALSASESHSSPIGVFLAVFLGCLALLMGCRRQPSESERIAGEKAISHMISRIAAGYGRDYENRNVIALAADLAARVRPFAADFSVHEAGVTRTCARPDSGRRPDLTQDQCRQILSFMKTCVEVARAGAPRK